MSDYDEHETALESDFLVGGWTAVCSCGWVGAWRATASEASTSANEHTEDTTDE